MLVRATRFGFYLHKRNVGDVFEFAGRPSLLWMEPVDKAAQEAFIALGWKPSVAAPAPTSPPAPDAPSRGRGRGRRTVLVDGGPGDGVYSAPSTEGVTPYVESGAPTGDKEVL